MISLRDYQQQAVAEVAQHLADGRRRVILVAPTGSGKTVMSTEIMRAAAALGFRVLFLVHRRELVMQTAATLRAYGLPCGLVLAGERGREYEPIQVASVQTLARRALPPADLVIIDEAHHYLETNTYGRLLAQLPNARVVGLSATPWRLDGKGLGDLFDAYVMTHTPAELRNEGHLCSVTGWVFKPLDTTGVRISGGDYRESDLANIKLPREILGDVVGEWRARAGGVRTILFACGVEHSKAFCREFQAAGIPAEHVDGTTPAAERAAILERVRSGQTLVLGNCAVATEGFDLPQLACVILARPTQSSALYLQMVGRVLRPAPGKTVARIHDHAGNVERHGEPYAERDYSPQRAETRRGKEDGPAPLPRCGKCGAITSEKPCPECGSAAGGIAPIKQVLEVEAVALEAVAQAQSGEKPPQGRVTFKKVGQEVIGTLVNRTPGQGIYGPEVHLSFVGPDENRFWVVETSDLRSKVPQQFGSLIRIAYLGETELGDGKVKKNFQVWVQKDAPAEQLRKCEYCEVEKPSSWFFGKSQSCDPCVKDFWLPSHRVNPCLRAGCEERATHFVHEADDSGGGFRKHGFCFMHAKESTKSCAQCRVEKPGHMYSAEENLALHRGAWVCKPCNERGARKRDREAQLVNLPTNTTKQCAGCKVDKSLAEYHPQAKGKLWRTSKCKACICERRKQRTAITHPCPSCGEATAGNTYCAPCKRQLDAQSRTKQRPDNAQAIRAERARQLRMSRAATKLRQKLAKTEATEVKEVRT